MATLTMRPAKVLWDCEAGESRTNMGSPRGTRSAPGSFADRAVMIPMTARSVSSFVGRVRVEVRPRSSSDASPVAGIHAQKLPGKHRLLQAPVSLRCKGASGRLWSPPPSGLGGDRTKESLDGARRRLDRLRGVVRIDDGIDDGAATRRTGSNAGSR